MKFIVQDCGQQMEKQVDIGRFELDVEHWAAVPVDLGEGPGQNNRRQSESKQRRHNLQR